MPKITKPQQALLDKAEHMSIISLPKGEYVFSDGSNARRNLVEKMISAGHLLANNDGLMEGFTQSYSVKK